MNPLSLFSERHMAYRRIAHPPREGTWGAPTISPPPRTVDVPGEISSNPPNGPLQPLTYEERMARELGSDDFEAAASEPSEDPPPTYEDAVRDRWNARPRDQRDIVAHGRSSSVPANVTLNPRVESTSTQTSPPVPAASSDPTEQDSETNNDDLTLRPSTSLPLEGALARTAEMARIAQQHPPPSPYPVKSLQIRITKAADSNLETLFRGTNPGRKSLPLALTLRANALQINIPITLKKRNHDHRPQEDDWTNDRDPVTEDVLKLRMEQVPPNEYLQIRTLVAWHGRIPCEMWDARKQDAEHMQCMLIGPEFWCLAGHVDWPLKWKEPRQEGGGIWGMIRGWIG
ncbi:hypothetical protein EJ04DRAFT_526459 [Polyplosphaeria fusca]|uniref:Uncharacterized protein n=1 Tax=Polyplosphaeria fusca TaxID=682080 RepID=A0A9P4UWF5_9PLEO|nr:hypothetical protein EJ04DRAFT_526459 [Polyplosphaeria fusca]